ncbi:hybrid sensor histidine kinase/response regulator [Leptolyngbya sp. NIES-2104]|uniref:hybrid sensor histidine kinase/response regulator n=1 Tax=Leptolyngbya sp. NIES-2104 TaxID=1552121 RepID=UPI0006ECC469|nr:hybrid sensor histidine kinase/response regulator [Leptolyngbya sp. NIES-2104]GAP94540.1 signal transduction histidine kinase CheA [Leptolyngbya sp. NIES-2104]
MVSDPQLREQTYSYFLTEAQDLLQSIEQNLFLLRQDRSAAKVHELMRAAHTLKGAAASVGFESMKSIAHSFEDVFKALYKPEVEVDSELEALLYEGYDCLRLPLTTAIAGVACQDAELLNRSEAIFSKIRNKLGKHFDTNAALPTSAELGFDIVQSLFETGVRERLEQLAILISEGNSTTIAQTLETQAEVFLGLAESLNLSGFGAIAQTAMTALKRNPDRAVEIAQAALADFRQGQIAVLEGDRDLGGEVSAVLKQLAGLQKSHRVESSGKQSTWARLKGFFQRSAIASPAKLPAITPAQPVLEVNDPFIVDSELEALATQFEALGEGLSKGTDLEFERWNGSVSQADSSSPTPQIESAHVASQKLTVQDTVRVNLAHLESLNFTTSELLIHQNQQLLQDERLQVMLRELLDRLNHHQQVLTQLRDWAFFAPERLANQTQSLTAASKIKQRFDSLELDRYNELHLLLQTALTGAEQLETSAEAIDFLARESRLARGKQGRLLTNLRDDLMTVRMMPIGAILNRLPAVIQQLSETHGKTVNLKLVGTQVMVDKALAEKLYQPLLHLVRNAFDHGIESDVDRQRQGKPIGEIEIRAYQQGNRTFVEVSDDGRGLDLQAICQQGFEQQRLASNQVEHFNEAELFSLLFEPGFSTAQGVTDLSGRGIGLDVVRSQMRAIQGNVAVTSVPNQGTTFSMQLPLTLISARLLLCQAGQAIYGVISEEVTRIVSPNATEIEQLGNQRMLRWHFEGEEHTVSIHSLPQAITHTNWLAGMQSTGNATEEFETVPTLTSSILILKHQKGWIGIEVDRVLNEQELVLRPVGSAIAPPSYVYGCSVLGNGRSLLAIDLVALIEQNRTRSRVAPVAPQSVARSTRTILVIDDSMTVRQVVSAALDSAGYQVIQAKDGLDAIEQLQQHPEIELITCDVEMPRLNGFEFLTRYEQEAQLAQVPVIMLTSRSNEKHQQLAKQLGAAAYLTKPFDQTELVEFVNQLIEGKVAR